MAPNPRHLLPALLVTSAFHIGRAFGQETVEVITTVKTVPCSTVQSISAGYSFPSISHGKEGPSDGAGSTLPSMSRDFLAPSLSLGDMPSTIKDDVSATMPVSTLDLASLCRAYSGGAASSVGPGSGDSLGSLDGPRTGNGSSTGNGSVSSSGGSVPNWTLTPEDVALPPTIPEPAPHSLDNAATSLLIRTVQDKVLQNYEAYSTFNCFQGGSTFDCRGPWLYANQWDKTTLSRRIFSNTLTKPSYYCSYDSTYLQSSAFDRTFYGFTAANLSSSLQALTNYTSLWAAGACTANNTCASTYKNDTEQIYADFKGYIQSGLLDTLTTSLQDEKLSYCPFAPSGSASLLTYATSYFESSREYFGLHNPLFVEGVAALINGTLQEARLELGLSLARNAQRAEGTFLNMIFFTPHTATKKRKRSTEDQDEEIYPGCPRREYVLNGHCEGVLPPREYDLAGEFMPMKERDQLEVWGLASTGKSLAPRHVSRFGLVRRDTCDAKQANIQSSIHNIEIARDVLGTSMALLASAQLISLGIEVGAGAAAAGALLGPASLFLFGLALPELLTLAFFAECQPFHTCDGIPPAAMEVAGVIGKFQAGILAKSLAERAGVKNLVGLLRRVVSQGNLGALAKVENVAAAGTGTLVGLGGTIADKLLSNAQKYYEGALACCKTNCASGVCIQASLRCILSFGDQWSGSGGLRCDAT